MRNPTLFRPILICAAEINGCACTGNDFLVAEPLRPHDVCTQKLTGLYQGRGIILTRGAYVVGDAGTEESGLVLNILYHDI